MAMMITRDTVAATVADVANSGETISALYYHNDGGFITWLHGKHLYDLSCLFHMFGNMVENPSMVSVAKADPVTIADQQFFPLLVTAHGDTENPPPAHGMHLVLTGTFVPATPYYFPDQRLRDHFYSKFPCSH